MLLKRRQTMGNCNSNAIRVFYFECNDDEMKRDIVTTFRKEYSDEKITGIWMNSDTDKSMTETCHWVIEMGPKTKYKVKFRDSNQIVQFVKKLGRPFIIEGDLPLDSYRIRFVYHPGLDDTASQDKWLEHT